MRMALFCTWKRPTQNLALKLNGFNSDGDCTQYRFRVAPRSPERDYSIRHLPVYLTQYVSIKPIACQIWQVGFQTIASLTRFLSYSRS